MKPHINPDIQAQVQQTAQRIVGGWFMTIVGCFIALRLAAYFGVYGFFGLLLLMVPAFALYQSWKPWLRYIFFGE